jgi:hypothetical protein
MSAQQLTDAIQAYLANGGEVHQCPTLYADGCNGRDDLASDLEDAD